MLQLTLTHDNALPHISIRQPKYKSLVHASVLLKTSPMKEITVDLRWKLWLLGICRLWLSHRLESSVYLFTYSNVLAAWEQLQQQPQQCGAYSEHAPHSELS